MGQLQLPHANPEAPSPRRGIRCARKCCDMSGLPITYVSVNLGER